MPSFDIVSKVNLQEVDNAVNQAKKEIETRYDFRGSKSSVTLSGKDEIEIIADDDFKLNAVVEILKAKMVKRNVSLKSLELGKVEKASGDTLRQKIKIKQGLTQDEMKELSKIIKDTKLKVQTQIMGDELRVSGKKIDDLQTVIAHLKSIDFKVPLQFVNYRD
ncbi:MAG: YajQ family cyclic di-GMP-binding protein [Proteobacteria bacterium]|nr:YajQ family cyclic di-GMP-binding protein [Pseudomonadota bacterium]